MRAILSQYLNNYLRSKYRVAAFAFFIVLLNFFIWMQPQTSILDYGFADLSVLFQYLPLVLMVFIPSIMMNFMTEDFRDGTSAFLFSKPLSLMGYWGGYVLGAFSLCVLLIALTFISVFALNELTLDGTQLDYLQFLASYTGVLLLSCVFIVLSSFSASLTQNANAGFLLGAIMCYAFYSLPSLISELPQFAFGVDARIQYFSLGFHLENLGRGILELRTILYFISLTLFFSYFTIRILKSRLS